MALGCLALPLLLGVANALRVRNCNLGAGLAFFALLPASTAVFAAIVGAQAALLLPRRGRLAAHAIVVGSFAWSLARLYVDPPVFALDPFGGFFPGPIYDEALRPPDTLWRFRAANLVWVAALAAVAHAVLVRRASGRWARRPTTLAVGLAAAALGLWGARGALGFHRGADDVRRELDRTTRSAHFVVHSDPRAEDAATLQRFHDDLEFRYAQLVRLLGAEPAGPVEVFRFPSAAAKKRLVGAGGTLFTRPWRRQIFLNDEPFPSPRLRHELAHVFAAAFGDPVFGVALRWGALGLLPPPRLASGLIEGIAEAAAFGDPDGDATLHQEAAAIAADGRAPPLASVVGAGFTALSGPRAYTLAGSFCAFLLDRFGADKLRALHRSAGDFPVVYGVALAALEHDWRSFLAEQPVPPRLRAGAAERFRRPAIFHKICARELAARVADARAVLYVDPPRAAALFASTCEDDPGEPSYRVEWLEALALAGEADRALALSAALAADETVTPPLRARVLRLRAAIHFHARRWPEARSAVQAALELASDDADLRLGLVQLRALDDAEASATLGPIFFGKSPLRAPDAGHVVYLLTEFVRRFPDDPLGGYLLGRQLATRDGDAATAHLAPACPRLPPILAKECRRLLGVTAFLTGDLARARAAFAELRDAATGEADRLRADDWLERIAWTEARRAPRPARR